MKANVKEILLYFTGGLLLAAGFDVAQRIGQQKVGNALRNARTGDGVEIPHDSGVTVLTKMPNEQPTSTGNGDFVG